MNKLLRFKIIDQCLLDTGKKYDWKLLLDYLNMRLEEADTMFISKSTLFNDLNEMKIVFNAPIESVGKKNEKYYTYTDKEYSFYKQTVNENELVKINNALEIISKFEGLPQFEWVAETITKLENSFGVNYGKKDIISFDSNIDYVGLKFIQPLFAAINSNQVLELQYKNFKTKISTKITIHPQFLKQYNSRWFLLAYNETYKTKPQIFALDRIVGFKQILKIEYINLNIDWKDYFYDIVGVTKPEGEIEKIVIQILDKEQVDYIETKPLHPTQTKIKKLDTCFETTIKLIPNYELEKLLLSFGERIIVKEPARLKEKITNKIIKMNENYL